MDGLADGDDRSAGALEANEDHDVTNEPDHPTEGVDEEVVRDVVADAHVCLSASHVKRETERAKCSLGYNLMTRIELFLESM